MKKVLMLGTLSVLASCGTTPSLDKHSQLTGQARNEMALKLASAKTSSKMDKYFSDSRELKTACIVGMRYKAIVNDNTANSKSESSQNIGGGRELVTTTTTTFDFKPSPFYFQSLADYAYDRMASDLQKYGYKVIDKTTVGSSAAYNSKGDAGKISIDRTPQYSGYFDHDPQGLRDYEWGTFSITRLLTSDDEWGTQFYNETKCDLMINGMFINNMKVLGAGSEGGVEGMGVDSFVEFKFDAYVPWALWDKSMKEIDSKIYGATNGGGSAVMNKGIKLLLVYPMSTGNNSQDVNNKLNGYSERLLKESIDLSLDYTLRAFHQEVYTKKKLPEGQI